MNLRTELRQLLAECERGLSDCDDLDARLLAVADETDKQRTAELEDQRKALHTEDNPYRLRAAEEMYLASLVDRARARRIARNLRNRQTEAKDTEGVRGEALIADPRRR